MNTDLKQKSHHIHSGVWKLSSALHPLIGDPFMPFICLMLESDIIFPKFNIKKQKHGISFGMWLLSYVLNIYTYTVDVL